ncbi:efflux RND transporter periplasmic adaptor subunit [Chitinispirillales bacterium ANBcel5]|uniref:efflux RND transporter periplasmic adaptor subunit n=1 Tax=Cellulosispirillum alkaliphilum TaxID=3039283 RepID=UPI002A51996A|nr:efflux RND transporter periplasmic adaptor subunit [Chitinispirillales bacterium ANBcel5]
MKKAAIFSVCFASLFVGCTREHEQAALTIEEIQAKQGIPVKVSTPEVKNLFSVEKAGGTVEGIRQTYLSTAAPGTINRIPVSVGSQVPRGGLVATMEFDEGAPLTVAQSAYVYASESLNRIEELFEEGAVSQGEVEKVRAQYEQARHRKGQATVAQFIRAPFAGTVVEILESQGTKADVKTPVVLLADLSEVLIDLRVHDRAIHRYQKGQRAYIVTEADTLWGTVERTSLSAHPLTHGFKVTVRFPNDKRILRPGMYRQVFTVTEERSEVLSIPVESLRRDGDEWYVYTVTNGITEKRAVVPGISSGGMIEIVSGLSEDEAVVVRGTSKINHNQKVNIINT